MQDVTFIRKMKKMTKMGAFSTLRFFGPFFDDMCGVQHYRSFSRPVINKPDLKKNPFSVKFCCIPIFL